MPTDFSSLDKLVEFGLGVGIANQMMNTMNTALARTAVPGVGVNPGVAVNQNGLAPTALNPNTPSAAQGAPAAPVAEKSYYIVCDNRVAGPMTPAELEELIRRNLVTAKTFCWSPGMTGWALAEDIPEVNKYILLNSVK